MVVTKENLNKRKMSFLEKASAKYNNFYTYPYLDEEFETVNSIITVCCPIHGEFKQRARKHLEGRLPCAKCVRDKVKQKTAYKTFEWFLENARLIHGDKYEYDESSYNQCQGSKIRIYCPEHGWFEQIEWVHLKGHGCPACSNCKHHNTESFIIKAKSIHGDRYDYSKTVYGKNNRELITVTCKKHGDIIISPHNHLYGDGGCLQCAYEKTGISARKTTEQFVNEAKTIHNDCYDYSKVNYINATEKVCIICPKHGEFWQAPNEHLSGSGCPKCILKSQEKIYSFLKEMFPSENWEWESSPIWLGLQRFDIYCKRVNLAIEYNGEQHYHIVKRFGGEEGFKKCLQRDALKKQLCEENNCTLYIIKYDDVNYDRIREDISNILNSNKNETC